MQYRTRLARPTKGRFKQTPRSRSQRLNRGAVYASNPAALSLCMALKHFMSIQKSHCTDISLLTTTLSTNYLFKSSLIPNYRKDKQELTLQSPQQLREAAQLRSDHADSLHNNKSNTLTFSRYNCTRSLAHDWQLRKYTASICIKQQIASIERIFVEASFQRRFNSQIQLAPGAIRPNSPSNRLWTPRWHQQPGETL